MLAIQHLKLFRINVGKNPEAIRSNGTFVVTLSLFSHRTHDVQVGISKEMTLFDSTIKLVKCWVLNRVTFKLIVSLTFDASYFLYMQPWHVTYEVTKFIVFVLRCCIAILSHHSKSEPYLCLWIE